MIYLKQKHMKGKFIVIDGTDGSGKGTQTELLVKRLEAEGHAVALADFPRHGQRSATLVDDYLTGAFGTAEEVGAYRASIFFACDRYAASFEIKKQLEEGKIVISNRYVSANMGHQAGKIKEISEVEKFLVWLENLEYGIFDIPKPDATILLYMPVEIGQQLVDKKGNRDYVGGENRDIHEDDIGHLTDAASAYLYVAKKYNWPTVQCAPDSNLRTIEDIHEELWMLVSKII
jgi:dTMP kinase